MKNYFLTLAVLLAMFACTSPKSGEGEAQDSENQMTEEEAVETIVQELESVQAEVKSETEDTLEEVDSLLNTL